MYKHTSERSGKSYIGITSRTMEERWKEHCSDAKNRPVTHFHRAISLYGTDNWLHEVVVSDIDTIEEACALEMYYIKALDTFENGYNSNYGGTGYELSAGSLRSKSEKLREHAQKTFDNLDVEFYNYPTNEKLVGTRRSIEKLLGLDRGSLYRVAASIDISYNGIMLYSSYLEGKVPIGYKRYLFEHKEHGVTNLSVSDMVNRYTGLNAPQLYSVASGATNSHKGWTIAGNQHLLDKLSTSHNAKKVVLTNVDTLEVIALPSIQKAVKYLGSTAKKVQLALKKRKEINGYIISKEV